MILIVSVSDVRLLTVQNVFPISRQSVAVRKVFL